MKDLNFFKPYQGKNKEKINSRIYIYGAMVIVALLIVGTFGVNTVRIILLNRSIDDYNKKLSDPEIQEQLREADDINKQITTLKKYDSALTDVAVSVKNRDNVSDVLLMDISSTVPSEVSFKNLDISDNTITIKGVSTSRSAVAELKHNLSSLPKMQDVYVNSIDNSGAVEGEYSFDIKCMLKDVE
ncbi:PilN domain-containing protein [Clostridium beijerinckii]|uniref:Type IV pilus assembly protein PilN n=1 Tax=Clostridium beijerinckii TaxID=1520 RepID=A0AAX0B812_CLOBE|nr:PilN domain-containing protein [Clostridium beijerinckii]MBA8933108.1 type IV pilus assembly protein PilN [Clostridium beijerinckii]NRT91530.1 type IV pilus assembly protein PilN [Clostridium beijerinckii]NRU37310.1 type IV pilus assembly protein PilN [Clostridium beijerinckii]NSA99411.1 type IV pilus assembly protein PilN [Clostridium beijerinckii]NYC71055.1 type IV pilus assembly protein PilN [Clostridium beijerinckii]